MVVENGDVLFGILDIWVLWNLIGGLWGGVYVIDVINVSWIMLMDLEMLDWDDELLLLFLIFWVMLFEIVLLVLLEFYGVMLVIGFVGGEVLIIGVFGD